MSSASSSPGDTIGRRIGESSTRLVAMPREFAEPDTKNSSALVTADGAKLAGYSVKEMEFLRKPQKAFQLGRIPAKALAEDDYVAAASYIIERDYYPDLKRLRLAEQIANAEKEGKGRDQQVVALRQELLRLTPVTPGINARNAAMNYTPGAPKRREDGAMKALPGEIDGSSSSSSSSVMASGGASHFCTGQEIVDLTGRSIDSRTKELVDMSLASGKGVVVDLGVRLDQFHSRYGSEDNASFQSAYEEHLSKKRAEQSWIEDQANSHNAMLADKREAAALGQKVEGVALALNSSAAVARNPLLFNSNGLQKQPFMFENKPDNVNTRFHTTDYERDSTEIQMENRANAREESLRDRDNNDMAVAGRFDAAKPGGYLATPTMVPGVDVTPIMTYGRIASTPLQLGASAGGAAGEDAFSIPKESDREQLAHRLLDEENRKKKRKSEAPSQLAVEMSRRQSARSILGRSSRSSIRSTIGADTPGVGGDLLELNFQ
ncbi:DiGeorge syndrome critical region protein 14 [Perkinsus olseni]|uniref:DiGeorge syndrome critical region protein 14 n=1 Tax=Perkinsus olseni TaxID=32597 RepID=A0A7J6UCN6_PEROL|nr:DiGeorge syndrome critical region protein 14 [Perkinsus olseni]